MLLSLITACCLAIPSVRAAASPDAALDAYQQGNFRSAQAQYSQLAKQQPDDARLRFNAGAAAYKNNDLTNAASWFESVVGAPDLNLQQQAYYNLGNTRYRLGETATDPQARMQEWQQAVQHLGSALKLNAADTNAAANLAFVQRRLEELKQQMPPPQSQQGQGDKDQKQDQKQQQQQQSQQDSQKQDQSESQKQPGEDQQSQQQQQAKDQQANQSKGDEAGSEEQKAQQAQSQKAGEAAGKESAGAAGEPMAEQQGKPGEMSVVQAERMLDQQKGEEKAMIFRAQGGSGKEAGQRAQRNRKQW